MPRNGANLWNKADEMDESDYTEDSWATFLSTWNRVKSYETSSKLPMVNILGISYYINQLQTALDALEEKPVLDADPASLEDGKYTLKAYMYKTSDPTSIQWPTMHKPQCLAGSKGRRVLPDCAVHRHVHV